mgnify:FL=1
MKILQRNKQKGITLIALVVTIIVLLILAGVTINLTVGENGIFNKAKFAKEKYTNEEYAEQEQLNEIYAYLNKDSKLPENTKDTDMGTQVKLPSEWYSTTAAYVSTEDGKTVTKEVKTASVIAVATGSGETVPVPNGFYYVGGNKSTGVVISDKPADQNKYAGYKEDGKTVKDVGVELEGNQFVWIPCTIENYKKKDFGATYASAGWDDQTTGGEEAQIRKYGGFYIARYEAGLGASGVDNPMQAVTATTNSTYSWSWLSDVYTKEKLASTAKPTSKANEIPWYHANYFTAVEMSKRMYANSNSVTSDLVTGTMWDVMVQYIASSSEYTSSGDWGNYNDSSINLDRGYYTNVNSSGTTDGFKAVTSEQKSGTRASGYNYVLLSTGASDEAKRKNVYDVAGNLWEWTTESSYIASYAKYSKTDFNVNTHLLRGGSFNHACGSSPACFRSGNFAANTHTSFGFRIALYIK